MSSSRFTKLCLVLAAFYLGTSRELDLLAACPGVNLCSDPWTTVTNASILNSGTGEIQITPNTAWQVGAAWDNNKVDLTQNFSLSFQVYLGSINGTGGADGIAFVLQNDSRGTGAIGNAGGNLGIANNPVGGGPSNTSITPSVAVEFDTYQNTAGNPPATNDPSYDHIMIDEGGNVVHSGTCTTPSGGSITTTTGTCPVQASATNASIKDGLWHNVKITWDATNHVMQVFFDSSLRLTYTNNIVSNIFGGNSCVYLGFTGATGGSINDQRVRLCPVPSLTAGCASNMTIDGNLSEAAWGSTAWTPINKVTSGSTTVNGQVKTLWDLTYLYVAVQVFDTAPHDNGGPPSNSYNSSSVELFFDGDNTQDGGALASDDFHYTLRYDNTGFYSSGGNTNSTGVLTGTSTNASYYITEWAIPWSTLGYTPASLNQYGFDVQVDVANATNRIAQLSWAGNTNDYLETLSYGKLNLGSCIFPTFTPSPTYSNSPTPSFTPTITPTPTISPTFTVSPTPVPNTFNNWCITTLAGNNPGFSGDGGVATAAQLNQPVGVAVDSSGNIYIGDNANQRIRKVTSGGIISTLAGNGSAGNPGDGGPSTAAQLNGPGALAVDSSGNLYEFDTNGERIRKIAAGTGIITTIAGQASLSGFSGDGGPATAATMNVNSPLSELALDPSGANLYFADTYNNRIRKINLSTGIITTVAGTGTGGFSGDGGQATAAQLNAPLGVAIDPSGNNLYIADTNNNRVRKVNLSTGIISTVAGSGGAGFSGDGGLATAATFNGLRSLVVDASGNIFVSDAYNYRIREINQAGYIQTIAGTGNNAFNGDGSPASTKWLTEPSQLAMDGSGNIYFADRNNHRIRELSLSCITPTPTYTPIPSTCNPQLVTDGAVASACYNPTNTISFNNPGGTNTLMLVRIENGSNSTVLPTSVSYAGSGLTFIRQDPIYTTGSLASYYLKSPATGANNLVINYASGACNWNVVVEVYSNVDQTNPIGGSNATYTTNNLNSFTTAISTLGPASVIDDFLAIPQVYSGGVTVTLGTGQVSNGFTPVGCCEEIYGDHKPVGAASTYQMTYSLSQNKQFASQLIEIRGPACTLPSPTPTASPTFTPTFTPTPTATPSVTPKMALTKSANVSTATIGTTITYTISWNNDSTSTTTMNVWDTIPAQIGYIGCSNACTKSGNVVSWSFSTGAGTSGSVTFWGVVNSYPP